MYIIMVWEHEEGDGGGGLTENEHAMAGRPSGPRKAGPVFFMVELDHCVWLSNLYVLVLWVKSS